MLSPFQIRNLRPTQSKATEDSLVRISAPGYDETISMNPAAKLRYQDDDEGDLITVGSSTELVQKLEEPLSQPSRHRPQSDLNPMAITTLLSESQQSPPSSIHHIFDIENLDEIRNLWQDIQARNSTLKPSVAGCEVKDRRILSGTEETQKPDKTEMMKTEIQTKTSSLGTNPLASPSENKLDSKGRLEAGKLSDFLRAYNKLRSTIWGPFAQEIGTSWREAEAIHWEFGEDALGGRATDEMLKTLETTSNGASNASRSNTNPPSNPLRGQSFNNDSPDFSDYRAFHFKTTMPPQLRLDERSIVKPYTTIEAQTNALTSAVPGLLVGSVKTNPFENLPTEDKLGNVAQGFDGPSLTSEGKRQAQIAGDKFRNRTNPIRHSRPSRGSISENGISKNRWSTYAPRPTRLDGRGDPQTESKQRSLSGGAELLENAGQPSLLELFETELAKNMTTNDKPQDNVEAIVLEGSNTSTSELQVLNPRNVSVAAQREPQHEHNPLLEGLKLMNDHLQGLTVGDEDLPQEFPKAISHGFRAAIGGISTFMRGVTSGLQEASVLTRQAAERTRGVDLQVIDDTISGLRTVAGEVTALGREILPELPKADNTRVMENNAGSATIPPDPPAATISDLDESTSLASKATNPTFNPQDEKVEGSLETRVKRPVSVVKATSGSKTINIRQASAPNFVSDIPVSITRSTRSESRRPPRNTGQNRAPRYHKPGPIHLPHNPLDRTPVVRARSSAARPGYVDQLRRHQSTESFYEPESSQLTALPAVAARFPTLAQFEGQDFVSEKAFPPLSRTSTEPSIPLQSAPLEPVVPQEINPENRPNAFDAPSQIWAKDQSDDGSAAFASRTLVDRSEAQSQRQSPAVEEKSFEVCANTLMNNQGFQPTSTNEIRANDSGDAGANSFLCNTSKASQQRLYNPPGNLQDYHMQLKLLEAQSAKRFALAQKGSDDRKSDAQVRTQAPSNASQPGNRTKTKTSSLNWHGPGGLLKPCSISGMKWMCMTRHCEMKFDTCEEGSEHLRTGSCHRRDESDSQVPAQDAIASNSSSSRTKEAGSLPGKDAVKKTDTGFAARLAKPFDPLEAESSVRPHPTEEIRRNGTVAGTDSRLNARGHRPYYGATHNGYYRSSPQPAPFTSPPLSSTARGPHRSRSYHSASFAGPVPPTRSSTVAPTMQFVDSNNRRKIYRCVTQLQDLGFADDGYNGPERLMQYASAVGGDLVAAIDMIDEEQRAYEQREATSQAARASSWW